MNDSPNTHHCECGARFTDYSNNSECSDCYHDRLKLEVAESEQEELDYQNFLKEHNLN